MVTVALYYANTRYVDTTLKITFFGSPSDSNSTATIVLSVVFGIAGAVLIAAAVILLVFYRRKQNGLKFRLVEPDYDALVFTEECNYIVSKKVMAALLPLEEVSSHRQSRLMSRSSWQMRIIGRYCCACAGPWKGSIWIEFLELCCSLWSRAN
jgi:hypothetical protein